MMENISVVPIKIGDEVIMAAIQENGWYIDSVEKTPERCLAAVKQNGRVLKLIPKDLHSIALCLEAIKQNASAIEFVSKDILTYDFFVKAVRSNGAVIAHSTYIPVECQTKELFLEAIKQNGKALKYVPDKYKSENTCWTAIMQDGLALEFVPINIMSKELFFSAVRQNGLALKFVPSLRKSKELCTTAVKNKALALEFVPDRYKKLDLCNTAIQLDWKAFLYVPESMYNLTNCIETFERIISECDNLSDHSYFSDHSYIREIVKRLPVDINNDIQIIKLERQLQVRGFKRKYFEKESRKFITIEKTCHKEEDEINEFDLFVDFYKHLDGDLKNANLHDYDFVGVNLVDFNIEGAYISSAILIEQQLYDDSFYSRNVKDSECNINNMISADNEIVEASSVLHDTDLVSYTTLNDNSHKIYYVSDIHLNHKLLKVFPSHATKLEVKIYIRQLVKKMVDTISDENFEDDDYLLIAGDISFNFNVSALFYTELVKYMESKFGSWSTSQIVVVLGNHELWDFNPHGTPHTHTLTLDEIIQRYRDLFSSLDICFLQNDLLISSGMIISEEHLKSIDSEELKNICLKSAFVILGGLGFSGLNSEFNATQGIYRKTIISIDEDKEQTERFEFIYNKVRESLSGTQVVILTHMPKENWSSTDYNSNWIYVSGHTHRNDFCCNEEKTLYSDNQIGYHSTNIGLKHFKLSRVYDIFRYYLNGIYIISREEYLDFNRGVGIDITFNRMGKIHMLKNTNVYSFMFEDSKTGKLSLLNGGMKKNLEHSDIYYYFERMSYYSDAIKSLFSGYNQALKSISNSIKNIGGTGTVHGCIVDIDYNNHIYFNPYEGTIIPYFAWSINDRYEYHDVKTLLLERRRDLYDNYMKLFDNNSNDIKLLRGETNVESTEISRFVTDTDMYIPSRIMRSLQYLTDVNVIRLWNDRIMDNQPCIVQRQTSIKSSSE